MRKLYKREYLSSPVSEFVSMTVIAILLAVGGRLVCAAKGWRVNCSSGTWWFLAKSYPRPGR